MCSRRDVTMNQCLWVRAFKVDMYRFPINHHHHHHHHEHHHLHLHCIWGAAGWGVVHEHERSLATHRPQKCRKEAISSKQGNDGLNDQVPAYLQETS